MQQCMYVRMKTRRGSKEDSAMDTLVVKGTYAEEFDPLVAKNRYSVERDREREMRREFPMR